jgi:putative PIN family toxin of toxin-antitoxin system
MAAEPKRYLGMVRRKERTPVVLDTNVFVRNFKSRRRANPNKRVVHLWLLEKRLQLILCREVLEEYLGIFADVLNMDKQTLEKWRSRFEEDSRCSVVRLGRRYTESRDPDDNIWLATAHTGHAEYLVTNDRDLLDLPADFQSKLPFMILTPFKFNQEFERS